MVLLVGGLFAAAVTLIAYSMVGVSGWVPWSLAGAIILVASAIIGVVAGVALAGTSGIRNWVESLAIGPSLSKAVFAQTLGVTDKHPAGNSELANSLHGASVGDARRQVREALHDAFHNGTLDRWLPARGRWLTSRIVNSVGWLAAKAAVAQLPEVVNDTSRFDLISLRDSVGTNIDEMAMAYTIDRVRFLARFLIAIGGGAAVLLIWLVTWAADLFAG